jgi:hypothetical protein
MAPILRTLLLCPLLAVSVSAHGDADTAPSAHPGHPAQAMSRPGAPATGQRWQADAPLRAGMARVRVATDALAHLQHDHLDPLQVLALADELRSAVNTMFAQCRLRPEPDAALHPLLARILVASQALRDKPADAAPVAELEAVLAQYRKLFDDRGRSGATH